jgi:hypothetical protein
MPRPAASGGAVAGGRHQEVQQAAGIGLALRPGGDGEDADEGGGDVFSGDVGAEVTRHAAGVEDRGDGREQLGPGLGMGDLARLDHRKQRAEHAVLGRDPVPEQVHPAPHRGGRGQLAQQLAGASREPHDLVPVDRVNQRLAGREVPVERGDADAGLAGDRAHRRVNVGRHEHAGRRREQLFAVAGRVRSRRAGLRLSQNGSDSGCARFVHANGA